MPRLAATLALIASVVFCADSADQLRPLVTKGFCGSRKATDTAVCGGGFGASESGVASMRQCALRCLRKCDGCKYASYSKRSNDCSLYSSCDVNKLGHRADYRTAHVGGMLVTLLSSAFGNHVGNSGGGAIATLVRPNRTVEASSPPRVNASSSSSSGACALVSSSGALLANSRGAAIDAHQLVARIGLSPTASFEAYAGRPRTASCTSLIYLIACYSLLHPVLHPLGARTSVRFVQLSFFEAARNMSPSKLRHVLELDRLTTPNFTVTFSGTAYEIQRLKLKQVATRFMRREVPQQPFTTTTPLPRCNMAGCETGDRIITGRYPSSGVLALQSMFDHHQCAWVQLFGFDDPDHGSHPYHYWADGSVHDGQSSQVFYGSKLRQSSGSHDFEAEHWFLYNVLGKGSWRIDAQAYRRECIHPRRAPACASLPHRTTDEPARALPQLELPPFTKRLFPSSAPFLVLPQHWSRSKAVAARTSYGIQL